MNRILVPPSPLSLSSPHFTTLHFIALRLRQDITTTTDHTAALLIQLTNSESLTTNTKAEVTRLQSRILPSPDVLRKTLTELSANVCAFLLFNLFFQMHIFVVLLCHNIL